MSNSIYNIIGGQCSTGNIGALISQFNQFRSTFRGDPKAQVQLLLDSGRISQAQYNNAVQQAKELQKMLGL